MTDADRDQLGWWAIAGSELLAALHRVRDGDAPDIVYAELYANSETTKAGDPDD